MYSPDGRREGPKTIIIYLPIGKWGDIRRRGDFETEQADKSGNDFALYSGDTQLESKPRHHSS